MITFLKVKIKNYRSIGNIELNIDGQGLVSILGANLDDPLSPSNGVGKSTILSAFKWGLFGVSTDGDKADDILSWNNPKDCSTEIIFIKDEQLAEIIRYRKHKQHGNNVYFYIDKQPVNAAKNKDIQPLIDAYLGFDENVFSILLTMGSLSKNAEPFMYMNDSGRKEFTDFLLNLSYLSECLKEVKGDIDNMEKDIASLIDDTSKKSLIVEGLKAKIQEYNDISGEWKNSHEASLVAHKEAIAKTTELISVAKDDIEKTAEALKVLKKKENEAYSRSTEMAVEVNNKKHEVSEIDKSLFSNQWEIEDIMKKISIPGLSSFDTNLVSTEYDAELLEKNNTFVELDKKLGILSSKKSHIESNKNTTINILSDEIREKIIILENQVTDHTTKKAVCQAEKNSVKKDYDEVKEFIDTGNLKCPKCRQAVDKEHLLAELEALKQSHNMKVDAIKTYTDSITLCKKDIDTLWNCGVAENTKKYETEILEIETEISNTKVQLATLDSEIKALHETKNEATKKLRAEQKEKYNREEQERVSKLNEKLDALAAEKEKLNTLKIKAEAAYNEAVGELKNIKSRLSFLSKKKSLRPKMRPMRLSRLYLTLNPH